MQPGRTERTEDPPPTIELIFEGRRCRVPAGISVAGALARLGYWDLSHSLKYHRPQGAWCMSGHCNHCAMRIDGLPNRLACQTPVHDGIAVERQNVLLSARLDPIHIAHKYFGFRFDHHHFMARPRLLNAIFVRVARRLSGLGKLPDASVPAARLPHRRETADVLVVGAGNAGMAAVKELTAAGREVLWVEQRSEPGGRLLGLPDDVRTRHDFPTHDQCVAFTRLPGVRWMPSSRVLGWFEDEGFVIRAPREMLSIRARHAMLCTGTTDLLPGFPGGDLPGILSPRGAQRLLLEEGYRPRGLIVLAGGFETLMLLEEALVARGDRVLTTDDVIAAKGDRRISAARIRYEGRETWVELHKGLLVVESGRANALDLYQQAGGRVIYHKASGVFRPESINTTAPDGCAVWVGGSILGGLMSGSGPLAQSVVQLLLAGPRHDVPLPSGPPEIVAEVAAQRQSPHPRAVICTCEDVTAADVSSAIARGYADMELLKRYTGLATGPCQGKACLCHAARLLAASRDAEAVRPIRFRPPTTPVSLAEVSGEDAP